MKQIKVGLNAVSCDKTKYNKIEVEFWKKRFLAKKPIPSPWINEKNEVISFYNCYFVSKKLGIDKIIVVKAGK